jgi:Flp pilus assembly protein TadG
MRRRGYRFFFILRRRTEGVIAVEFAILGTLFFMLVAGIVDFGHAYYMKQIVTNASREGARYGISYQADPVSGARKVPSAFSPSIKNYVLNTYLAHTILPADAAADVTVAGTGYSTGTKGAPLEVTVTAKKTWFLLYGFVPGVGHSKTLTATTVMQCE